MDTAWIGRKQACELRQCIPCPSINVSNVPSYLPKVRHFINSVRRAGVRDCAHAMGISGKSGVGEGWLW